MYDEKYSDDTKASLIIQFVLFEVSDLIFDWDFFFEVSGSKEFKGKPITSAICLFALWGTLLFFMDLICLLHVVCKGRPSKAEDLVTCLTTWTEDVPQIFLAARVASIVGKPITGWVQYTKAILGILESIIRILTIICNCCTDSYNQYGKRSKRCCPECADTLNFIGYAIILICAIVIWQSLQDENHD